MNREAQIKSKLDAFFGAESYTLVNDSERHKDHAGHDESGQTHFRLNVRSPHFSGKNRVERQRIVYTVLDEVFKSGLHSLTVTALSPEE